MLIKVIGKSHMEGTSKKSGNAYNFNTVHFNAKARGVDGLAAKSANIDNSFMRFEDIVIGGLRSFANWRIKWQRLLPMRFMVFGTCFRMVLFSR